MFGQYTKEHFSVPAYISSDLRWWIVVEHLDCFIYVSLKFISVFVCFPILGSFGKYIMADECGERNVCVCI